MSFHENPDKTFSKDCTLDPSKKNSANQRGLSTSVSCFNFRMRITKATRKWGNKSTASKKTTGVIHSNKKMQSLNCSKRSFLREEGDGGCCDKSETTFA